MSRKLLLCTTVCVLFSITIKAQFIENFADGNFSDNPIWVGNTSDWVINNSQLQSNNSVANSSYYLSTGSTIASAAQWDFHVNLKFATSGTNYADVYLTASASDIGAATTTGYFVRIGNTADDICLYRKDAGAAKFIKIIDGTDGAVSSTTNNDIKVNVIRTADKHWYLKRQLATDVNYVSEGDVMDATYTTSAYFGILVKQSTVASFSKKHFFGAIAVKVYNPDITPPTVQAISVTNANNLDILFSEPIDESAAEAITNYEVDNNIGSPAFATVDIVDKALVHLKFIKTFPDAINCLLTTKNVKDLPGNPITQKTSSFIYYAPYVPAQFDIVIDEIMTDPSPAVSLPNNKWIELKNTCSKTINLLNWRIGNGVVISGPLPNFILTPNSFVIVCTSSAVASMAVFGNAIGVTNFPSLNNDGDELALFSPTGKTIHAVACSKTWYQNELKQNGGWSLEMIDTKNACSGISNWKASTNSKGGSPGIKNSIDAVNADNTPPKILSATVPDDKTINLTFSEPMDSNTLANKANYRLNENAGMPASVLIKGPIFNKVQLQFTDPLTVSKIYLISALNLTDCAGNIIDANNKLRVGLSEDAAPQDIVINEILYNPPTNGSDYVEIYNRSNKIINLRQTYIANRGYTNAIESITPVSNDDLLFFPKDYMLLTNDIQSIKTNYISQNLANFLPVKLPAYNNDKGTVIIINAQGKITDEVTYNDKWQFKLLVNTEGVALERIDFNGLSQSADNWHSAATSVGYGTPAYKNSQLRSTDELAGEIKITPEIISPDNDGYNDYATIDYNFNEPGYIANITIFDGVGRPVRYLQKNALCGTKGNFRWDGLGEKNQPLAMGIYIIYTSIFNLAGKSKQFKVPIVLARRN